MVHIAAHNTHNEFSNNLYIKYNYIKFPPYSFQLFLNIKKYIVYIFFLNIKKEEIKYGDIPLNY